MWVHRSCSVLGALLALSCGSGGGASSAAPAAPMTDVSLGEAPPREAPEQASATVDKDRRDRALDWYPLRRGARWEYQVNTQTKLEAPGEHNFTMRTGRVIDECLGPSPGEQRVVLLHRLVREFDPSVDPMIAFVVVLRLRVAPNAISALSTQPKGHPRVDYDEPHPVFSLKLVPRDTVEPLVALELVSMPVEQRTDPVTVPFGAYRDASLRVSRGTVRGEFNSAPVQAGSVEERTWFARGVGPVRVERTLDFTILTAAGETRVFERMVRELADFDRGVET